MPNITIQIYGDKKILAKLKRLGESILIMPEAMREIGNRTKSYYENEGFASMGGVFGQPWQRLSPATTRSKIKRYPRFANVPLIATGTMQKSFSAHPQSSSVTITNSAPYFVYHQSSAPRSRLPRRQMMGINDPIKDIIKDAVKRDIENKLRG